MTDVLSKEAVLPFGKYKGQPMEVLRSDHEYREWLMGQSWFRERHAALYTLVINHFGEPNETPEHNQMAARLLDPDYRRAAIAAFVRSAVGRGTVKFGIKGGLDVPPYWSWEDLAGAGVIMATAGTARFEWRGFDVYLWAELRAVVNGKQSDDEGIELGIEIKPAMGDDFPAVLRKLHQVGTTQGYAAVLRAGKMLLVGEYTGTGATLDDVHSIFAASHIALVTAAEVWEWYGLIQARDGNV